jgi:uncharacterized protein
MKKLVLFIQGGGKGGFEADAKLVASLQEALGEGFEVRYPPINTDENLPDFGWLQQIGKEIEMINDNSFLVGHSLGASMLLKFLSENQIAKKIQGIFLVSTPFWTGEDEWVKGLKLQEGFTEKLPENVPVFLYQCKDDKEIPFTHLGIYEQKLPYAAIRKIKKGGHQLNNNLAIVAEDIKSL